MVKAGDAMRSSGEGLKAAGQRMEAGDGGGNGAEPDVSNHSDKGGDGSAPRSKM